MCPTFLFRLCLSASAQGSPGLCCASAMSPWPRGQGGGAGGGGDCTTGGGRPTAQSPAGPSWAVGVQPPGRGRTALLGDGSVWQRQKQGVKTTAGHQTHTSPLRLPGETHSPGGLQDRHLFLTSGGWESESRPRPAGLFPERTLFSAYRRAATFLPCPHMTDRQTDRELEPSGVSWKGDNAIVGTSSNPNYPPKAHLLTPPHWGSTYESGGDTTQSIMF